jgi:hypothetical protein
MSLRQAWRQTTTANKFIAVCAIGRRLAILTVFLAVTQAAIPAPQKASNSKVSSASEQGPPATTPPIAVPQQTNGQTSNHVADPKSGKDGWEKAAVISNYLLVIVGVCGVVAAIRTLSQVKRQVREMNGQGLIMAQTLLTIQEQATHMQGQVEEMKAQTVVAQTSADAARRSAEISVGISIPTLVIHEFGTGIIGTATAEAFFQYPKITITVKNYGQTPALLQWWTLCFACEELPDVPIYEGPASGIPLEKLVVQAGEAFTLPQLPFYHRDYFSTDEVAAIVAGEKTFIAYGYICYGDIFGNPFRRLKFCASVLNIVGGEVMCDWWSGFSPAAYVGTDNLPVGKMVRS